jgi:hypothetical protein
LNETQRMVVWANIMARGLGITAEEAYKRIRRNNALPIEEVERASGVGAFSTGIGTVVYPRFSANAVLLAQASPDFEGPRGRRPSLVSLANILRVSGVTERQAVDFGAKLARASGGIVNLLRELDLSAANPKSVPEGVEFSAEDMKNGIYIPKKVDIATARAIGIAFGDGFISSIRPGAIQLHSSMTNGCLYEGVIQKVFEEAFNFRSDRKALIVHSPANGKYRESDSVGLAYSSKAVGGYFVNHLGFPTSAEVRRETGLPPQIMEAEKTIRDEFLKYFLATAIAFDDTGAGGIVISNASAPLLRDIESLIRARVTKQSITHRQRENSFGLCLSTIPSMELYVQGFLDANSRLNAEAAEFWDRRMGSRALSYLERTYGFVGKSDRLGRRATTLLPIDRTL